MSGERPNQKREKEKEENTLEPHIQTVIAEGNTPSIGKTVNPNPTKPPPLHFQQKGLGST